MQAETSSSRAESTASLERIILGDFEYFFIEELGWNRWRPGRPPSGRPANFVPLAEKGGVPVFLILDHSAYVDDASLRGSALRKLHRAFHEHLLIFYALNQGQVWSWHEHENDRIRIYEMKNLTPELVGYIRAYLSFEIGEVAPTVLDMVRRLRSLFLSCSSGSQPRSMTRTKA